MSIRSLIKLWLANWLGQRAGRREAQAEQKAAAAAQQVQVDDAVRKAAADAPRTRGDLSRRLRDGDTGF